MEANKKYLIVYHKEDNDGVMSCALMKYYLENVLHVNETLIHLLGVNYNDLQWMWDKMQVQVWKEFYEYVIMTDISFSDYRIMKRLYEDFGDKFIWIDHHEPIIVESYNHEFNTIQGIRDSSRSAILNMYHYLYDALDIAYINKKAPELLRILSAYDSYTFNKEGYSYDYVNNINLAFTTIYELDVNRCYALLNEIMYHNENDEWVNNDEKSNKLIEYLYKIGDVINTYNNQRYENIIRNSGDLNWKVNGRPACALFMQGQTSSQNFSSVKDKVKNGLVFKHLPDSRWVISLYNTNYEDNSFNCGEYLKHKYNGGGHFGAAGCTVSEQQFIKILKAQEL